jgi:hypothetical protein
MFCPVCKSEYREGFNRCADCDVPLVNSLASEKEPLDHASLENLWQGNDRRISSIVCSELERLGVPYREQKADSRFLGLSNQPEIAIFVPRAHVKQAREALSALPWADTDGNDETEDSVARKMQADDETDLGADFSSAAGSWHPEDWNPDDATVRVWADPRGETTGTGMIVASLEENRIHWRANDSDNPDEDADAPITEIYVMPEDEVRAREIIREVTEASPPA